MPDLSCSFCNRTVDQVLKLIEGPGVYICDVCVKDFAKKNRGSAKQASRRTKVQTKKDRHGGVDDK